MQQVYIEEVTEKDRNEKKLHVGLVDLGVLKLEKGSQGEHACTQHLGPGSAVGKASHPLPVKKQKDKQDAHHQVDVVGRFIAIRIYAQELLVVSQLADETERHRDHQGSIEMLPHLRDRLQLLTVPSQLIDDHGIGKKPAEIQIVFQGILRRLQKYINNLPTEIKADGQHGYSKGLLFEPDADRQYVGQQPQEVSNDAYDHPKCLPVECRLDDYELVHKASPHYWLLAGLSTRGTSAKLPSSYGLKALFQSAFR